MRIIAAATVPSTRRQSISAALSPRSGPRAWSHAPGRCDRRAKQSLRWSAGKRPSWISLRMTEQRSSTSAFLSPFKCGSIVSRRGNHKLGNALSVLFQIPRNTLMRRSKKTDRGKENKAQRQSTPEKKGSPKAPRACYTRVRLEADFPKHLDNPLAFGRRRECAARSRR